VIIHFILYLLYGLAFFTLGVAILSRDVRFSELGIARIIWLLAIFGIIHGFHEWLELLEYLVPAIRTPFFSLFRLIVVSISFLFLLYFGLFINIITFYGDQALRTTPQIVKILIGMSALSLIFTAIYFDLGSGKRCEYPCFCRISRRVTVRDWADYVFTNRPNILQKCGY